MFSWNKSSSSAGSYPANRGTNNSTSTINSNLNSSQYSNASSSNLNNSVNSAGPSGIPREEHLSSYLTHPVLQPSTRRVSRQDDSTYDTVFQTQNGSAMILRVHMPAGNPAPVPKMTLVGVQATHPWIDDKMRITGYQYINSQYHWSTSGIKLGQAVDGVIKYLQLNPPNIVQITDPGLQRIQESIQSRNASAASFSSTSTTATNLPLPYNQALKLDGNSSASAYNDIPIPPVPSSFPGLDTMSRSEMEDLLNNQDKLLVFIEDMPSVKTLQELKDSISERNVKTAETNLQKQEVLISLHSQVQSLQQALKEKMEELESLQSQQNELCKPPSTIKPLIGQLQKLKRDAFDESEELASNWMDGDTDTDEFLEAFLDKRIVHHVRAAKIERLNALEAA